MTTTQKRVFWILTLIAIAYFVAFIPANNTGAKDQMMISLFEPDEFAQYPIVLKMLTPHDELDKTILNFVAYRHYYYGSPFYFSSAILLLPIQIFDNIRKTTQLNMLLLRQFIGILPMIGTLLLLTYTQTKFKSSLKSIVLFVLLLSVSAVVENNMWWHVDSLACFFVALTIFFLDKDDLRFGRDFIFAASSTGLATGTKVIGLFFFLSIPTYLILGILNNRLSWKTAFQRAVFFVMVMAVTIVLVNPFILIPGQFNKMIEILSHQSSSQNTGWVLNYATGPASWYPIIQRLYGEFIFIALAFFTLGLGIWRSETRVRHLMIATWAIPFGLYVLFFVAIKPTHFFLPILLPVYSSLIILVEDLNSGKPRQTISWVLSVVAILIIMYQFGIYIKKDITMYREVLTREEHEESLVFYDVLERDYLPRLNTSEELVAFRDVRMYFPDDSRWVVRSYWNSKYSTIEQIHPDLIILWSQRILDYTQEGAQENAADPASFQDTYQFYVDADHDQLRGYRLVYRDAEGLFFVTDDIYEKYFQ